MATIFNNPCDLLGKEGQTLGVSDWILVDQKRVNLFADATGDHQWIHVDTDRAKNGPFGATIAHGFLTLALVNLFLPQIIEIRGVKMGINYGCEKVRFPAPVRVGSRVRGLGEIISVKEVKDDAVQAVIRVTVEIENEPRPACVAETISRYYF